MKYLLILFLATAGLGCSKDKLKQLEQLSVVQSKTTTVDMNFCTIEADRVKAKLKFIFVIDKSYSNKAADPAIVGSTASDPDGNKRYLPLKSFVDSNPDPVDATDNSISFALVNFSTDSAIIPGPASSKRFMPKDEFRGLLETEHNPPGSTTGPLDSGGTNYLAALTNVFTLIDNDITAAKNSAALTGNPTSSFYVVFFVSDGFPKVGGNNQAEVDIVNKILTVKSLEDRERLYVDAVQVNTGYYYQSAPDLSAAQLLEKMSSTGVGDGSFLEFGAGETVDFSRFAVPERNVRHLLKDILVTNMNTLWNESFLEYDTDADGLSDREEIRLGSNPYDSDSDDNDVSDGIELLALGRPCKGASCVVASRELFPACDAITEGRKGDIDRDGMNNCTEKILGTRYTAFDSNSDWIPDDFSVRMGLAFLENTQEINLDSDNDGANNYQELKTFTPMRFDNSKIIDLKKYEYKLSKTSQDSKKDCYRLTVSNIATVTDSDLIRVYVLEAASVIEDKRFMRMAEKRIAGQGGIVQFSESDLK
jgi:hypothetical protein